MRKLQTLERFLTTEPHGWSLIIFLIGTTLGIVLVCKLIVLLVSLPDGFFYVHEDENAPFHSYGPFTRNCLYLFHIWGTEEGFFRVVLIGIVVKLTHHQIWPMLGIVLVSSALFGIVHSYTFTHHKNPWLQLTQFTPLGGRRLVIANLLIRGLFIGTVLAFVYIKTGGWRGVNNFAWISVTLVHLGNNFLADHLPSTRKPVS